MQSYNKAFYESRDANTRYSAQAIAAVVLDLVKIRSVIDVGCGVGTWLDVFKSLGVNDIWGVEGEWLDKKHLVIPENSFSYWDLREPLDIRRTFDLAMSLEVAEHLPAEYAEAFVDSLVGLAPVIVFAAAIPGQGGAGHFNERSNSYVISEFAKRGLVFDEEESQNLRKHTTLKWLGNTLMKFDRKRGYNRERGGKGFYK